MTCNMRSTKEAIIGDTFFLKDQPVEPLMEVTKPKPMVYAGFYPLDPSEQVFSSIYIFMLLKILLIVIVTSYLWIRNLFLFK